MEKLRVAVIGAGGIAGTHLESYAAWPELCEIVGVADVDRAAAEKRAAAFGCRAYEGYAELMDTERPAAISICTPPDSHRPIALAAAEREISVLCEKPPARTLAGVQAMVDAFTGRDAVLQFAFCHRFHQPVEQAQELIASGKLGEVVQIYNRFGFRFERAEDRWFTQAQSAGGGILIDTLVHSVDIFRALAGEVRRVEAAIATYLPIDVDDTASMLLVSESGVLGSLTCSWVTPVSEAEVRIYGTEGEAIVDYGQPNGLRYKLVGDGDWTQLPFTAANRFVRQAEHFLNCVRTGEPPLVGSADALAVMKVIRASYLSAREG